MPLPTGTWFLNGNGFTGDLTVNSVDAHGNLNATVYGGQQTTGFWDETAQKITFMRLSNPADPSSFQVYTGYLFHNVSGIDTIYTLAGSFEAFAGTGAVAQRVLYGWFANITVIGKDINKDTKDNKDTAKEKEKDTTKDKEKESAKDLENPPPTQVSKEGGPSHATGHIGDQSAGVGRAFIRAEERPPVGRQILQEANQVQGV